MACKFKSADPLPYGARVCVGMLNLADFQREFARWSISTRIDDCR